MKSGNLTLSIIIPTLNSGKNISLLLDNILSQVFKDYELLVIDNASKDATVEIVRKYATTHNNIRLITEPDQGIYDAMNKGVRMAKGEWLYFIGSDDRILSNMVLCEINKVIELNKYDIIYGNVISPRFEGSYDSAFDQEKIFHKNLCHQAIFFKRNIFNKTGHFNLKYRTLADWDHNMKWILDPGIKKKYHAIDIAEFADGGASSVSNDIKFEDDRVYNYLKYGISIFKFKKSMRLIFSLLKTSVKNRDVLRIFKLGLLVISIPVQKIRTRIY